MEINITVAPNRENKYKLENETANKENIIKEVSYNQFPLSLFFFPVAIHENVNNLENKN